MGSAQRPVPSVLVVGGRRVCDASSAQIVVLVPWHVRPLDQSHGFPHHAIVRVAESFADGPSRVDAGEPPHRDRSHGARLQRRGVQRAADCPQNRLGTYLTAQIPPGESLKVSKPACLQSCHPVAGHLLTMLGSASRALQGPSDGRRALWSSKPSRASSDTPCLGNVSGVSASRRPQGIGRVWGVSAGSALEDVDCGGGL